MNKWWYIVDRVAGDNKRGSNNDVKCLIISFSLSLLHFFSLYFFINHFFADPTSILVRWIPPEFVNGRLKRYILYASMDEGELGEVGYNDTDLFTQYILNDLTPGADYYISVAVSSEKVREVFLSICEISIILWCLCLNVKFIFMKKYTGYNKQPHDKSNTCKICQLVKKIGQIVIFNSK